MADNRQAGQKKQKLQLAMEEAELRSLRIPSSAHRGTLSPSKNSFLPTLQEQGQERIQQHSHDRHRRLGAGGEGSGDEDDEAEKMQRPQREANEKWSDHVVLSDMSADVLENLKQDFVFSSNGALDLEQFTRAMLRNLPVAGNEAGSRKPARGVNFDDDQRTGRAAGASWDPAGLPSSSPRDWPEESVRAACVIDLFRRVDVHGEGSLTWDEVSNYIIEQGMAGRDEFTVDNIKTYEASSVLDISKHEDVVEKLVYLEEIDSVVCMSYNSRNFRLYDPKRCTLRHEVPGHRGTVINCCYVNAFDQIATSSADMTICLWDSTHLGLRNRLSTKDVQLCLQWDGYSGSLFSGSIDGTLSRWDLRDMCLAEKKSGQHKNKDGKHEAINDLLLVEEVNLASAGSDGTILMWDTSTMRPKKTFKGHKKGAFSLAYSLDYHCLLTAGLDLEALVWNPYVERVPIFRLKGHTHALCGVTVVPGSPQILTADVAGMFRLWDMRNFRCVQTFGGNELNDLNTFCAIPQHKRLAAGGSRLMLYDYMDEWGGESVTDTGGVTDALYNPRAGDFYTVSKRSVKAWHADTGQLFKVLRDIAPQEITSACLSDNGRKLYLGDSMGHVTAHALHNGAMLTKFESHATDVSCLAIWKGTNKVISAAWDGTVKIHSDERARSPQMKQEFQHHRDGVTCLACSPDLMLLASGGTDMKVNLYDLRTLKHEECLARFRHVVAALDFLPDRCLLAAADQGGVVSLWRVRPHDHKWLCVCAFQNMPCFNELSIPGCSNPAAMGVQHPIAVQAVRFALPPENGEGKANNWLYTADAKGGVRCWDLNLLFERMQIHEVDLPDLFERARAGQLAISAGAHRPTNLLPGDGVGKRTAAPSPAGALTAPHDTRGDAQSSAFLTAVDPAADDVSDDDLKAGAATTMTTVRAAVGHSHDRDRYSSDIVGSNATAGADSSDVRLLFEADGHDDPVISMHITDGPRALITCGLDRRVRSWSERLETQGTLLQSSHLPFEFPFDTAAARKQRLDEASELLERLPDRAAESSSKLPPIAVSRDPDSAMKTLMDLSLDGKGKRRPQKKKSIDSAWRLMADQVTTDDIAEEEDFHAFSDHVAAALENVPNKVEDRLLRRAQKKQAVQIRQRNTNLSAIEVDAADRLAKAMKALGGEEFGTYCAAAMVDSIAPRRRADIEARHAGYPKAKR